VPRQPTGRFSRYLRSARLRQRERRGDSARNLVNSSRSRRESVAPARSARNSVIHPIPGPSTS
jgi:hypothetical protein